MDDIFRDLVQSALNCAETGDRPGVVELRARARNVDYIWNFTLLDCRRGDSAQLAVIFGDIRMRETGRRYPERSLTKKCPCKVSDSPQSETIDLQEWLRRNPPRADGTYKVEGKGEVTYFIGGTFFFENHESHPLLKVLPTFLHFSGTSGRTGENGKVVDWFGTTLEFISTEAAMRRPGAETIITRLSDILFIQAVRAYASAVSGEQPNWFAAAADPQVGEAIANIHRTPQSPWTVEQLATLSGMSRSAFANRFAKLVGESPLRYLARWRMHKAIEMIQEGRLATAEIAYRVGYESEAAFSKAFKKWNGQGPGAYRRAGRKNGIVEN